MKTYWDYTEQERSILTEDEVRSLLDVEMMKEGVKKPVAPKLADVPKSPLGARQRVFCIEGKSKYGSDENFSIVFLTIEQAQAFIELNPMKEDYDYEVGSEFRYFMPIQDAKIVNRELYSLEQINEFRSSLKQRKALADSNKNLQSDFVKASQKAEKITDGVWKDWYLNKSTSEELKSIIGTYKNYLELTKGDIGMALTFLGKVHNGDEIKQAREWFPDSIPDAAPAMPAVVPAENLTT